MGWEVRANGRRYLYRSVRRAGRVVREYLGSDDRCGFGRLRAEQWQLERLDRAVAGADAAARRVEDGDRLADLAALGDPGPLRDAAEALMVLLGFRRHNRGEWRMSGGLKNLKKQIEALSAEVRRPTPLVRYDAPSGDAEAVALFAAARAGDAAAVAKLPTLVRDRGWADWLGELGHQAAHQLIHRAAGGDPVFAAGLAAKAKDLYAELAGPAPTILERLLARRVVNGWLFVHTAELELAYARDATARRQLEGLLGRGERRMAAAVRELAVVRRLQAPVLMARLEPASPRPAALPAGPGR